MRARTLTCTGRTTEDLTRTFFLELRSKGFKCINHVWVDMEEVFQNEQFDVDYHPDMLCDHLCAINDPHGGDEADFWDRFYTLQNDPEEFCDEEIEMLLEQAKKLVDEGDSVHEANVRGVKSYLSYTENHL